MSENITAPVTPSGLGRCASCGAVYPVRRHAGDWHAIGTDGTCRCGGADFRLMRAE